MKQLFFFTVLLAVLGLVGFFYRATLEAPTHNTNAVGTECNADAKMCPDGSSVGRGGPSCIFAACPLPNVELPQIGISFVLPVSFAATSESPVPGDSLVASYERGLMSIPRDAITIRRYPIPEGKDANAVMLEEITYETSGQKPTSMQEFKPVIINGRTYQVISVDRFEGQVRTRYYLPRERDVLSFEVVDREVPEWTDPGLDIRTLRTHQALEGLLATLTSSN
jgi:hypothetical protein